MSKRGSKSAVFIGEVKAFERKTRKKKKNSKNKFSKSAQPLPGFQPVIKLKSKQLLEDMSLTELQEYFYNLKYWFDKLVLIYLKKQVMKEFSSISDDVIMNYSQKNLLKLIGDLQGKIRELEIREHNIRVIKSEIRQAKLESN